MSDSISTLAELKAASQTPTAARNRLTYLFDEGKFTELDAYAAAGDSLAGVITAFGYVEGNAVVPDRLQMECQRTVRYPLTDE